MPINANDLTGINIARVSTVPFFVSTQLNSQLRHLIDTNANVYVVCSDGPELSTLPHARNLFIEVIEICRKISFFHDLLAIFYLYRFLKYNNIDIVHSTTPKAGILTMIAAYLARTKIRLHTFTGQPWAVNRSFKSKVVKFVDRLICKLSTKTYADSVSQMKFLLLHGITQQDRISVIGNGSLAGIDHERFEVASRKFDRSKTLDSLNIGANSFIFIYVGRITPEKGIVELLEAHTQMRNLYPSVETVIVGPIDTETGSGQTFSNNSNLQRDGIHYTGFTSEPEKYLSIAHVLCLPSYREGFGTVVLEAAALGVPTIGSDIYGLQDAIVDGDTGLLVEPADVDKLFQAMERIYLDRQLRHDLARKAKLRCKADFDSADLSKKVINEYYTLLKGF